MKGSSDRFKALAVSSGITFWFFIITSTTGFFKIEYFVMFVIAIFSITQILSKRITKGLDVIGVMNTKVFLGILFVFLISIYGIFFRLLRIDLLRLKKQQDSYWLEMEQNIDERIFKQY